MKKVLFGIILLVIIFLFAGCGSNNSEESVEYTINYDDATSFENALNNGEKVNGKIVRFYIDDYVPNSILGVNCHAGEHLNFIFESELDVKKGDTIVVRVTEEPSKVFLLGSWKIYCEILEIIEVGDEIDIKNEDKEVDSQKIVVTMSEDDFKGMNYKDASLKFSEMGFTKFEYKTVNTENKSANDTICYIEINEFIIGNSNFISGDKFNHDSTVTFYYYKYNEPEVERSVYYSTNDYETAKKGNVGVFSYKNKSGSYDIYWIIDFDLGYVYFFTEGNEETTCDKVKIVSGDLNDRITVTWHDGGLQRSWYLHFKYKNQPETLVINDHNGIVTEFVPTKLDDALKIRNTKEIKEY